MNISCWYHFCYYGVKDKKLGVRDLDYFDVVIIIDKFEFI